MKKFLLLILLGCIKQVDGQIVTLIAGGGTCGPDSVSSYWGCGDGGPATGAELNEPRGITFDKSGNLYIADYGNNVIRRVSTAGIITTVVGYIPYAPGYSGNGGQATYARLYGPIGVAFDTTGNLYIADQINQVIRKVDKSGIISNVAGNAEAAGTQGVGYSGDGGLAIAETIHNPSGVAFDATGNMYIADSDNSRIRMVNSSGIISTVVGNGTAGYSGDGGQATDAKINGPNAIVFDVAGNLYISDLFNRSIRKVNTLGIISTVAGNGINGNSGNGGPATDAELGASTGIAFDLQGNLYINDEGNFTIHMVNSAGIISALKVYDGSLMQDTTSVINNYNATFDANGNLYFTNGVSAVFMISKPLNVTVNSATVCAGATATLTANGATTYSWTPSAGLNVDTGSSVIANPTVTTTYTVTGITNFSAFGVMATSIGIATSTVTIPAITVNSPTICIGDTVSLIANGANTYTWSTGASGSTIVSSPTVTTTYTITGTDANNCRREAEATVTINTPVISINSPTICIGGTTTLTASGVNTCTWSTGEVTTVIVASPTITTTYMVSGTVGTCTSVATSISTIMVDPMFIANLTGVQIDSADCGVNYGAISGIDISNISGGLPPYHYQWYSGWYPMYNDTLLSLTDVTSGTYSLQITDINGCAANIVGAAAAFNVPDINRPSVSFIIKPDSVPHTWDLYINYSADVINATWYWGDGTSTFALYSGHGYDIAGAYNICVTAYNSCGDSATFCLSDSLYRSSNSMIQVNVFKNTTGINQLSVNNESVSIYPNPNNGNFTIETTSTAKQTLQVVDVNGRVVLTQIINGTSTIDVSSLNDGVYNINITSNEGITNKRLVIVK